MAVLLTLLLVFAVTGLALSLVAHTAALLGLPQPLGPVTWGLHLGIFVVWVPVVLLVNRPAEGGKRKNTWEAALRGCPRWMRWLTFGFFGYAAVNFLVFMTLAPKRGDPKPAETPSVVFRGFSGHWMAFYSAAAAVLYSAATAAKSEAARRCPNGHRVAPSAGVCEVCGVAVFGQEVTGPGNA